MSSEDSGEAAARVDVPEMDRLLGVTLPVLDDGFVRVVDYMGGDASVVQAARVSYGRGTKRVSEDRGLIRYLMRHRHTTPFEMAELKLHVRAPMDCWRQWVRTRTACLAEGTELCFDLPGGLTRRGNQLSKLKIEEVWKRFQTTRNRTRPDKQRNPLFRRDQVQQMLLRQVDEDTRRIIHTRIVDVFDSGVKPVFRMVLADGKSIESTADHRFLFADGWHTLGARTGLRLQNGQAVWEQGDHYVYVNGVDTRVPAPYRDKAWLDEQYNSLFWRGGTSAERQNIGRWTTQIATRIHERNGWTCQLCRQRSGELHCHHIVPVWADGSLARDPANLTTSCGDCHRKAAGRELDFVVALGGGPVRTEWKKRPRVAWSRLVMAKLVRVERFEYVGLKSTYDLEVEGPYHNFIANGIVTHNSINEYSTRYSEAIDAAQRTPPDAWRSQSRDNRQGSGPPMDPAAGAALSAAEEDLQRRARALYEERLRSGVAREQARKDLPLSTYTEAYWKIDLHNLLRFLELRMEDHAQQEIREYARTIGQRIVAAWCPLTWEAFRDYRLEALTLSATECGILRAVLAGDRERALAVAREAGFLRPAAAGGASAGGEWQPSREGLELEEKMGRLGLAVPWR